MNDEELHSLLDGAANSFGPTLDVHRLESALEDHGRGTRPIVYGLGFAAALAIAVGGAAAMTGDSTEHIVPADDGAVTTTVEEWHTLEPDLLFQPPTTIAVTTTSAPETTTTLPATTVPATTVPPTTVPPTTSPEIAPLVTEPPAPTPPAAPATTHAPPPPAPPTTHPPTTHAPTTTQPAVGFTANQTWGTCGSEPPYEELFGRAASGATVNVSSPYGSGSTNADGAGHWYVKVFFPSAPPFEQFTINASSAQGSAAFPFTYTP